MNCLPKSSEFQFAVHEKQEIDKETAKEFVTPFFILRSDASYELKKINRSEKGRILTNKETHGYFEIYAKLLDRFKDNDITNIIELGIGSIDEDGDSTMYHYHKNLPEACGLEYFPGGSLILWEKYMSGRTNISGWDIDISKAQCPSAKLYETDSRDQSKLRLTLSRTLDDFARKGKKGIDLFIDDGLHSTESQQNVFKVVYPYLNPGGIFVIEDVTPPNYTLHKPTNNVINKDISAYKIMEMVSDVSGKQPHIYQTMGEHMDISGCIICVQK